MRACTPSVRKRPDVWRALLDALIEQAQLPIDLIEHPPPLPIADLWARGDKAAVFMCGLPFSRAEPQPVPIAAPVPSPIEFGGEARYWSDMVVRADSAFHDLRDTFGHRIAFTTSDSQSGYGAALSYFMGVGDRFPLFSEIIAPQITPLGRSDSGARRLRRRGADRFVCIAAVTAISAPN